MRGDEHIPHVQRGVEIGTAAHELCPPLQVLDAGFGQFHAHDARDRAADDTRDDREDQVEDADVFMVGRIDPPLPTGGSSVCGIGMSCFSVCHVLTF